ncbi:MAG TPA: hypothetical protein VH120_20730 [Gemmataceae bacterium]|jgi:hypothetical protein|nr:hypothetical protein [Gemmataceae bacterium]
MTRITRRLFTDVVIGLATLVLTVSPVLAAPVPATAPANAAVLAVVPAQAPIVLQVRGVERTKERLTAFLNAAVPDFGPVAAAQIDQLLKNGFEGRKLEGLAKDGPIFVAVLELPTGGAEPPVAVIARVTGYKAFRDGLLTEDERKAVKAESGYERAEIDGREIFFLDRQDFAVVTTSKDAAEMLAKKPSGMNEKLAPDFARQLLDNDVSIYVNLAAVNKEYGDQIKSFQQIMELGLNMAGGGGEKAAIEYAKLFYNGLFQAIADGRSFLMALDFRPEGMNLALQFQVGADTKTNKYLADQKPVGLEGLGRLPAGQMTYTATHMSGELLKSTAPLIYGAMGGEGDAKAHVEAAVKQLFAAGLTASYNCGNMPPAGVQVQTFDEPNKAAAAMLALFRAMGEGGTFQNNYIKGKPDIKENAEEYKGFKLNAVQITWDLDKFADSMPGGGDAVKTAIKKLLGQSLRLWFGTDGKQVVTVTAKDWEAAKQRLDTYLDGTSTLAKEPAYEATRKHLPPEATMLLLTDAGPFVQVMGDYMLGFFKAMPNQLPFNLPDEIKPVKTKTSYLGYAVILRPETATLDMFVPVTGIQEIRKVLQPLFLGGAQ